MARPLEYKRRVRMPDLEEPPLPRPRRTPVLAVGLSAWLASVAVAWGVSAGTIPVASWLERSHEPAHPAPPRAPRRLPPPLPLAEPSPRVAENRAEPAFEPVPAPEPALVPAQEPAIEPVAPPLAARAPAFEPVPTAEPTSGLPPAPRVAPAPEQPAAPPAPAAEPATGAGSSDGLSCEAAAAAANDELWIGGPRGPADLGAADYAKVLNGGGYLAGCGVPDSARVDVCAAVQNGRAVGVTVRLTPRSPSAERCVARAVRRLSFPAHPRLDVARTRFE
ncbi:MAG: hypothetical protein IPM35_04140 [Myxococcales bacterium]|nr:hypothetical protein [Myxococcales bacterium]